MRAVSTFLTLLLIAALTGCPSNRNTGDGDGDGDGDGNGDVDVGDVCDIEGLELSVPADDGEKAGGVAPDLSCIGNPVQVAASTPLTLQGCVDIFGVGDKARAGTEVAIFAADVDPKTGTPLATGLVAVSNQAGGLDCDGDDAEAAACRALNCDSEGFYRLDAQVPSNTPLTMRIKHPTDDTVIDTYLWGLVLLDPADDEGVYEYEAALIYSSTYSSIPTLSGRQIEGNQDLNDGVGRGVIAGEIHDCTDTIVGNTVVGMAGFEKSTMSIVYFNGEEDPNPDPVRTSTASDGLYAILNVPNDVEQTVVAGVRDPACSGDDCSCLSLGTRTVKAYADSVSIVTLRGDFPVAQ
ncbi:MAG: hypothetical protein FJ137_22770 [Deltaproteobacteria bacterium]|nr:hypothetical protein [Deltaproteobacteria bacterium]